MAETVVRMAKVNTRIVPSTGAIQFRFSDKEGNVAAVEMDIADAPRVLIALGNRIEQHVADPASPSRVMEITNLSAAVADDGTPVLTIDTKSLPGLSFAIAPDQVEGVAAWLENCLARLRGQTPTIQ